VVSIDIVTHATRDLLDCVRAVGSESVVPGDSGGAVKGKVVGATFIVPDAGPTVWTIVAVSPSKGMIYFAKDPRASEGRSMSTVQMAQWAKEGKLRFVPRERPAEIR